MYRSMIKSQSIYCLVVWIFHLKQSNNLINKLQEGAFEMVDDDQQIKFQDSIFKYELTTDPRNWLTYDRNI